ncbi:hypothetical protein [uncultured Alistipes sp.]|uniref:hypothetical protein n=1 Tax=uncultured Alistipes sp. TaxID=538949 RepID=UPI0025D53841|nr:hypothetical protein [uncultured Alistipes sp.]
MELKDSTNGDRMLRIVLSDPNLVQYGGYDPEDYETVDEALNSECVVVVAVAKFIQGMEHNYSPREIYTEIQNYLSANL